MALTFPTPPTAPTPPAVEKGDGNNSHAKIDAPNFFQIPFVKGGVNFKNPATEAFQPVAEEETDAEENFETEEVEEETPPQNSTGNRQVTTPETLARDAVANGAGALTKRTVTKPEQENSSPTTSANQNAVQIPQSNALTDSERGKAVLREFQAEDRQLSSEENNLQTETETPKTFNLNQQQSQGGFYWLVILVFAAVAGFIVVQKFLITDKPKLKKSDLFEDTSDRLKKVSEKVSSPTAKKSSPKVQRPVRVPKKDDDDKGKHFEVRV